MSDHALRCRCLALGNCANRVRGLVRQTSLNLGELSELCPGVWDPVLAVASQSHWEVHEKCSTRALRYRRLALGNCANRVCSLVCRMRLILGELSELRSGVPDPVLAVASQSHWEVHEKCSTRALR